VKCRKELFCRKARIQQIKRPLLPGPGGRGLFMMEASYRVAGYIQEELETPSAD